MPAGIAKDPELRVAKFRESVKARKAKGLRFGRKREYTIKGKYCRVCGEWFEFKKYPGKPSRRVCSGDCARVMARETRRKVPADYDLLNRMYWQENMSTVEIAAHFNTDHSVVRRRLVQLGIPARKVGHSRNLVCMVEGCNEEVFKVRHSSNGSKYGRRCREHWEQHRNQLGTEYRKRPNVKERVKKENARWYYLGATKLEGEKSWLHENRRLLRAVKRLLINPTETPEVLALRRGVSKQDQTSPH